MRDYHVRVELDEAASRGLRVTEIRRQLVDLQPEFSRNEHGRTDIVLHLAGQDIWLASLMIMVALTQISCEPFGIHVTRCGQLECPQPHADQNVERSPPF